MINKVKNLIKTSFFMKAGLFVAIVLISFANFTTNASAQYFYPNNGGYPYGYPYGTPYYTPITLTTTDATNITGTSAILTAQVNGNSLYSTNNVETWFQYGTNANLSFTTIHNYSNSGYAEFSSSVSNLNPNTIYYFRAVAQTPGGMVYGNTNSFRTTYAVATPIYNNYPVYPTSKNGSNVITEPAVSVSNTGVELSSLILNNSNDPYGSTWFEYGRSLDMVNTTASVSTGGLSSVKHVSTITGLYPGSTYYFRAVAANSSGIVRGSTLSFTTGGTRQITDYNTNNTPKVTSTDTINQAPAQTTNVNAASLGANAFNAGYFFPNNVFGWMILIILGLVLMLLIRNPHAKFWSTTKTEESHS
jgi:hypothetical protein